MHKVIFACVQNAGRSQMAAAWFNRLADPHLARAVSAGTRPAAHVHPEVVAAMREAGIDLADATPQALTPEVARSAQHIVTMGCGEECPTIPGATHTDWPIEDPHGLSIERVRAIRDEIRSRVEQLLQSRGWG
jgi:arsenate reductase